MKVKTFVVFTSLFIVLLIGVSSVSVAQATDQDSSDYQEVIQMTFPNSKITWSKQIDGEMVNFRANSTALAIMIGNGDKSKINFIDFNDTTEWSINCHNKSCLYYDIIGQDDPKLWIRGIKDGMPYTRVINSKGEEIINMKLESWLDPSPSVEYYYTSDNPDSYNQLKVYNKDGKFLWIRKTPRLKVWFVHALSDSELIYVDYQGCFLLNALNGEEIWKIPKEKFSKLTMGIPEFSTSSNGKYFIMRDIHDILSVDNEDKILWMKKVPTEILASSISNNGKFVALYTEKLKTGNSKKLEILDNFNDGRQIWESPIETLIKDVPSDIHGLKIRHNIISLTPGMVSYYTDEGITPEMQTFYFDIDSEKGTLSDQRVAEGVAETFQYGGEVLSYVLIDKDTHKQIFRIEQDKIK